MAITAKSLADGQLSNSKTTLYTVPVSAIAYVKFFSLHNTNAVTQTYIVYVTRSGGASRIIAYGTLTQHSTVRIIDTESLSLSAGDLIEAETTTAAAVDYLIAGAEQT
jgi:hypothetical protein